MSKTQKRIERRKAEKAARAAIVARNQADALQRHARQAERGFTPAQFNFDEELDCDHDYQTPDFETGEMICRWKRDDQDVWPAGFRGELGYSGTGLVGLPACETKNGKVIPAITPAEQASLVRQEQYKQALKASGANGHTRRSQHIPADFKTMSYADTQRVLSAYGSNASHDLGYQRKPKAKHTHCKEKACGCLLPERELRAQGFTDDEIEQIEQIRQQ